jgi:hypothetical protein
MKLSISEQTFVRLVRTFLATRLVWFSIKESPLMRVRLRISLYAALLLSVMTRADIARADSHCDPTTAASIHQMQFLVDSIRIDKPGAARVYTADHSEFTAGQALWMKGQMLEIERACATGDQADATRRLAAIQALVTTHSR